MIGTDMIRNNRIQMRLDFYTCDKMYRKESQKTDKLLLETKKNYNIENEKTDTFKRINDAIKDQRLENK
jgi:hypothetical protein